MSTSYRIVGRKRFNWPVIERMVSNKPNWTNFDLYVRHNNDGRTDAKVTSRAEFLRLCKAIDQRLEQDPTSSTIELVFVAGEDWLWLDVSKAGNVRYFTRYGRSMAHSFCDELDNQGISWVSEYDDAFFK